MQKLKGLVDLKDMLAFLGIVLVGGGIASWSISAAVVVVGIILLGVVAAGKIGGARHGDTR